MVLLKRFNDYLNNNWVPNPPYRDKVDRLINHLWVINVFLLGMVFALT